ncbi:MAG: PilN domain-containing protein [Candidatus Moranbacteria bacterium]|nr:PilN domain-containing protein [Candidatus Moranbacteria bacterium]
MEIKLNLIPQYKKDEITKLGIVRSVLRWEIELLLIFFIFIALLLSLKYILKFNLDAQVINFESKQNKEKYEKIVSLDDNFKNANVLVSVDDSIQKDQLYWSRMFGKLGEIIPDGVQVGKLANKNYRILVAGTADTRDILVDMKDRLAQEACFANVNLPLSNLVSKDNVEFQIEFDIKEECIKNK